MAALDGGSGAGPDDAEAGVLRLNDATHAALSTYLRGLGDRLPSVGPIEDGMWGRH
jgi:hypothetical protein